MTENKKKRKPIIAGNWKMNKTIEEAEKIVSDLVQEVGDVSAVDVVVCPPFTAIFPVNKIVRQSLISVGAQNLYYQESGAYTGEISPLMLKEAGCRYVIIGHSERRGYFKETDEEVNKKIKAALKADLFPIVCVGESLEDRENNRTFSVIENQIKNGLNGLTAEQMEKIIIAYEPIWAIGTGKNATPQQANEVHIFIREKIKELFGEERSSSTRIQYGGSVNSGNLESLIDESDIDGALVGGASLDSQGFARMVRIIDSKILN